MSNQDNKQENEYLSINIGKLLYYQKPVIGNINEPYAQDNQPIQIIYPSGNLGLGISESINSSTSNNDRSSHIGAIMSIPENNLVDINHRKSIVYVFIIIFLINMIMTILLYHNIASLDLSKVENGFSGSNFVFGIILETRSNSENAAFVFTLVLLIIGFFGAILEHPTILSIFVYTILLNFILGTQALPSYVYSFRYFLDFIMIYLALKLRSKCSVTFLPVHIHNT